MRSNKEILSLKFKKATEKARVKSFRSPIANFKIDQFASNECKDSQVFFCQLFSELTFYDRGL